MNHDIENVALFGYSQGGGSVRLLMDALVRAASLDSDLALQLTGDGFEEAGVNFFWGAYIDAVHINLDNPSDATGTLNPESEYPVYFLDTARGGYMGPTAFLNIYQRGFLPTWRDHIPLGGQLLDADEWSDTSGFARSPLRLVQHFTDAGGMWPVPLDHTDNEFHGIAEDGTVQNLVRQSITTYAGNSNVAG
jgi:hypothetical protein